MLTEKKWYEPEIFWCGLCGKPIWIQVTPVTQPEQLICDECVKSVLDKHRQKYPETTNTINKFIKGKKND